MAAVIGKSHHRKEAWQKVTGEAVYTEDMPAAGYLHGRMALSPHAHARILHIDTTEAQRVPGVKLVLTGADCPPRSGPVLKDRPLLARDLVRYAGEPVALVVARDEAAASAAAERIRVTYEPLPAVFDAHSAMQPEAPVLHSALGSYAHVVEDVYPRVNSNISSHYPIRKGDIAAGFAASDVIVTKTFDLPPSGHIAMELRCARARVLRDATVEITAASQSPFEVAKQISNSFGIAAGKVHVRVPFVGGAFGGKAPVVLELLALMASQTLGGRPVRLTATRKEDMATLPCRTGLHAEIKLGARRDGRLQAAQITFLVDSGAYADISPYMAKAIASNCTGPYHIEHVSCDSYSVYTNKTFVTSFRGYAHESAAFCIERTMDALARQLDLDPLALRSLNAIRPGSYTPTQVEATASNVGSLSQCIEGLKSLSEWNGKVVQVSEHVVRAKGCACIWKSPTPPVNASSGALVTVNADGSFNLSVGVVEIGDGGQSLLAQMFADRLGVTADQVHLNFTVDTRLKPEHYKTVASFTPYLAGRAVMRAADDVLEQIRTNASRLLQCSDEDIAVDDGRAFLRQDPARFLLLKDALAGYVSSEGGALGEPVLGRGSYMLKGITHLDPQTGKGHTAPSWTVAAQAVEVELDRRDCSYRITNAYTVMDMGKVLNPAEQRSMIQGGMALGLGLGSSEGYHYEDGQLTTPSLRTYKPRHFSGHPKYHVGFVETPQLDAPYGARCISEHGVIGMPAALANALSAAAGVAADALPVTPEVLWGLRSSFSEEKEAKRL